jgi:hypothetical protein
VLRHQLLIVMKHRGWGRMDGKGTTQQHVAAKDFISSHPFRLTIDDLTDLPSDRDMQQLYIDLRPHVT